MHGWRLTLGLACVGLAACASAAPTVSTAAAPETESAAATPAPVPAPVPTPPTRIVNPWTEPAREVLVQHCGRCHRSDLDTSLAGALAVYDLTKPVWYANLRPDQYDGILERVHEARAIGSEETATMEAFVACARGAGCPPPP